VPIWEGTTPCWEVRCERCGEGEDHYDTRAELIEAIEGLGWHIVRGLFNEPLEFYCDECTNDMMHRLGMLRFAWTP
jgi:hypothetical protein